MPSVSITWPVMSDGVSSNLALNRLEHKNHVPERQKFSRRSSTEAQVPPKQKGQGGSKKQQNKQGPASSSSDTSIRELRIQKARLSCQSATKALESVLRFVALAHTDSIMPLACSHIIVKVPSGHAQAQELRDAGKEPYAYTYDRTHMAAALHEQFTSLENGCEAELEVCCLSSAVRMSQAVHCALCSVSTTWSQQMHVAQPAEDSLSLAGWPGGVDHSHCYLLCTGYKQVLQPGILFPPILLRPLLRNAALCSGQGQSCSCCPLYCCGIWDVNVIVWCHRRRLQWRAGSWRGASWASWPS